ncbi:MAG: hypothetical protein M3426_06035 [Actinomycetota bacterium]|jgi:hypothetical protein|nr:hypothetical protein [Actinomycetota bacterium]
MLRTFKKNLFKEPRQGISDRVGMLFGCLGILVGCFVIFGHLFFSKYGGVLLDSIWVSLGLSIALRGIAELLPRTRIALAGSLHVAAVLQALVLLSVLVIATVIYNL